MQINDFKSILATFADPGTEILFEKSQVVVSVNGDLINAVVTTQAGDVYVDIGSGPEPASKWILTRLARIPLLATRLLESVPQTEFYVSPSACLLPTLEQSSQDKVESDDAVTSTLNSINGRSSLETTVLYITSDAGEGKTSLINQLARSQAKNFIEKKSGWLLVPIPLGGRHFLRFDDITVGVLQNKYRFPFLYYDSFLELVKMGVIVPAFDGFEEMFVESSSGEALSAMGILVGALDSQGSIMVAARKAYFEFENLKNQERLFDTIRTFSVSFEKLQLCRWSEKEFKSYCTNRGIKNSDEIYRRICERLTPNHALLTRAVLVKKLVDVVVESPTLDIFLEQLQKSGQDFFSVFVKGLIEREAYEKWLDRSGGNEVGSPLLSVQEHCELLSYIALSMWESKIDYLKRDNLEFAADFFSEATRKNAFQAQQIRERIRGHAMLIPSPNAVHAVEFDHDEFRHFFLGEGVAKQIKPLNDRAKSEVIGTFRKGVLPRHAQHALIRALTRQNNINRIQVIKFLHEISKLDPQASYTHENCSDLIIRLLSGIHGGGLDIQDMAFGPDSLRDRKLSNVNFIDCYFASTSLELTTLENCRFSNTNFSQLRIHNSTDFNKVEFNDCKVDALAHVDLNKQTWEPHDINNMLSQNGVTISDGEKAVIHSDEIKQPDAELRDFERIIRYFLRSTHISESIILMKLGENGRSFIDEILPRLIRCGIIVEIENRGGGAQRRFRLGVPLQMINSAIAISNGSFSDFLKEFGAD